MTTFCVKWLHSFSQICLLSIKVKLFLDFFTCDGEKLLRVIGIGRLGLGLKSQTHTSLPAYTQFSFKRIRGLRFAYF